MSTRTGKSDQGAIDSLLKFAFNEEYYSGRCPESLRYPKGALQHYLDIGWKNGFDPTPGFSGSGYLRANPDVARSGSNPFIHYLRYGIAEGRGGHVKSRADDIGFTFANADELANKILSLNDEEFRRLTSSARGLIAILDRLKY